MTDAPYLAPPSVAKLTNAVAPYPPRPPAASRNVRAPTLGLTAPGLPPGNYRQTANNRAAMATHNVDAHANDAFDQWYAGLAPEHKSQFIFQMPANPNLNGVASTPEENARVQEQGTKDNARRHFMAQLNAPIAPPPTAGGSPPPSSTPALRPLDTSMGPQMPPPAPLPGTYGSPEAGPVAPIAPATPLPGTRDSLLAGPMAPGMPPTPKLSAPLSAPGLPPVDSNVISAHQQLTKTAQRAADYRSSGAQIPFEEFSAMLDQQAQEDPETALKRAQAAEANARAQNMETPAERAAKLLQTKTLAEGKAREAKAAADAKALAGQTVTPKDQAAIDLAKAKQQAATQPRPLSAGEQAKLDAETAEVKARTAKLGAPAKPVPTAQDRAEYNAQVADWKEKRKTNPSLKAPVAPWDAHAEPWNPLGDAISATRQATTAPQPTTPKPSAAPQYTHTASSADGQKIGFNATTGQWEPMQ